MCVGGEGRRGGTKYNSNLFFLQVGDGLEEEEEGNGHGDTARSSLRLAVLSSSPPLAEGWVDSSVAGREGEGEGEEEEKRSYDTYDTCCVCDQGLVVQYQRM